MRLPGALRRRLDVATAAAQEALIDAHAHEALRLVSIVGHDWSFSEALTYYFDEMSITGPLAGSVRNRALVQMEDDRSLDADERSLLRRHPGDRDDDDEDDRFTWDSIRPDRLVKQVRRRQRRQAETGRLALLVLAQAEEAMLNVHVDNALDFIALLDEEMSPDRAVSYYVDAIGLSGCRAQAVVQRTMVRVADALLEPHEAPRGGIAR